MMQFMGIFLIAVCELHLFLFFYFNFPPHPIHLAVNLVENFRNRIVLIITTLAQTVL